MTTKTDRVPNLKRDLNNLKVKRDRMQSKIKELQVEMKLLDEKIQALEEDMSAEKQKAQKTALSINATITDVIASVMQNAAPEHRQKNSSTARTKSTSSHSLSSTSSSSTRASSSSSSSSNQRGAPVPVTSSDSRSSHRPPPSTLTGTTITAPIEATNTLTMTSNLSSVRNSNNLGAPIPVIDSQGNRNPFLSHFNAPNGNAMLQQPPRNWNPDLFAQPFYPRPPMMPVNGYVGSYCTPSTWPIDRDMRHPIIVTTNPMPSYLQPPPTTLHMTTATITPAVQQPQSQSRHTGNSAPKPNDHHPDKNHTHSVERPDRCRSSSSSNDPADGSEQDKLIFQTLPLAVEECIPLLEAQIMSKCP
jgi:hypothetical protein